MKPKASPIQSYALSLAVYVAYRAGWNGDLRKRGTRPHLRPGERFIPEPGGSGAMMRGPRRASRAFLVTGQSFQALAAKNFVDSATGKLTAEGIVAGEERYEKDHGRTAEQAANAHMLEQQVKEQEVQEKVERAKHLFRGFKLTRKVGKSRKIADQISRNGLPNNLLFLDDLIAFGEEIEELR